MSHLYVEHRDESQYPSHEYSFAPSVDYPEYQWDDISPELNEVYDMVRTCLYGYGFDKDNYGTSAWNPLADIISQGDTVVIKPNWVEDKNGNKRGGMECLVTHASIIRAVIDYVYLAIGNTGRIVVGDSPMPNCNFEQLMTIAHYDTVWESCAERSIDVEVEDFREDIVKGFANEVVNTDGSQDIIVDIGEDSMFASVEGNVGKYRNGIVDARQMNEFYHAGGHHRYGINKTVLQADVIINLPKPKTHRKAGFTGALKNYIGVCSRKISIPHNVMGSVKEGGDTYFGPKIVFETEQSIRDIQNTLQSEGKRFQGFVAKVCRIPFWLFRKVFHKRYFGTGNWYKNDTIWRSILDINRILVYADKDGILRTEPQRRFFSIGDMIIAGHKNGPLEPSPKHLGCIICSENPVAFDMALVHLMGFSVERLPVLNRIPEIQAFCLAESLEDSKVYSNDVGLNSICVKDMPFAPYGHFEPAEGWSVLIV